MAVLKSFELKGNKLSFANWISNLSPKGTPFTSMIGKEKIDQVQYSWQTDSLAPASSTTHAEGSQAFAQPRASTKLYTNFTSIVRKAVKVTETNSATTAYGRNDEMAYQMGKAGTELLRDIEQLNLSTREPRAGSATHASRYGGFKSMCAPLFVPDVDTRAITHQGVAIADPTKPWFTLEDVFKVTTNLFMAGSKADKIMFHPMHLKIFSDLLGYNEEEPLVYRLFDNLNDTYNMKVSKIRDPLGRLYTLVPNRFMPESEIYFFHESDWTQMVLKEPSQGNLSKKGSSDAKMVSAEIGLRHRHPYASGVMHLLSVDYTSQLTIDSTQLTPLSGKHSVMTITMQNLDGTPAANVDVNFSCSSDNVELETLATQTNDRGIATCNVYGRKPGHATIYAYRNDVSHRILSNSINLDVIQPVMTMEVDRPTLPVNKKLTAKVKITSPIDGYVAPTGTTVTWYADRKDILFYKVEDGTSIGLNPVVPTNSEGYSEVRFMADVPGEYHIWAVYNGISSVVQKVTVTSAGIKFDWGASPDLFTVDLDNAVPLTVSLLDSEDQPVEDGTEVVWQIENGSRGSLQLSQSVANGGSVRNEFTPQSEGVTYIALSVFGDVYKHRIECKNIAVDTVINPSNTLAVNEQATVQTTLYDAGSVPIRGKTVMWSALPSANVELGSVQGVTDADGTATTTITGKLKGIGELTTTISGKAMDTTKFYVGTGAKMTLAINPNPTRLGQDTHFSVALMGMDGVGLSGHTIDFTADPGIGDLSALSGETENDGTYDTDLIPLEDQDTTITARCDEFDCNISQLMAFTEQFYNYETSDSTKVTIGVGLPHPFTTTVSDVDSVPMDKVQLEYDVSDPTKLRIEVLNGGVTNAQGQNTINITPLAKGQTYITVKAKGKANTKTYRMEVLDPTLTMTVNPTLIAFGGSTTVSGVLTDANGGFVNNATVSFVVSPSGADDIPDIVTKLDGDYSYTWTPTINQEYEVFAFVKDYPSVQSRLETLQFS